MSPPAATSPFVVRAPRLRAAEDARAMLRDTEEACREALQGARNEADRLLAEAELDRAAACERALEGARERGRTEAAAEAAALLAQAADAVARFWRAREEELRDVALAIAHRVLAALPADETTSRLAMEAVAEHGRDARLALTAHPATVDRLRAALARLDALDRVGLTADPSLGPGDCTLLHPAGRTDVGLLAQFRAMVDGGGR